MRVKLSQAISSFLRNHNIGSHSAVAFYGLITGWLAADSTARTAVFNFLNHHPYISLMFSLASFIYAKYSSGHSLEAQAANVGTAAKEAKEMQVDLSHDN